MPKPDQALELARTCARLCDERKGEGIELLDVRDALKIADYFVIVTGKNSRHLRAMADELRRAARTAGIRVPREEGRAEDGRWVLVDFGDTIVHLFDPEARRFYDIEHLWGDVPRLAWSGEKSA